MWSTFGHCVKYIGVLSANYPCVLLDSFSVEQLIELGNMSGGLMISQSA